MGNGNSKTGGDALLDQAISTYSKIDIATKAIVKTTLEFISSLKELESCSNLSNLAFFAHLNPVSLASKPEPIVSSDYTVSSTKAILDKIHAFQKKLEQFENGLATWKSQNKGENKLTKKCTKLKLKQQKSIAREQEKKGIKYGRRLTKMTSKLEKVKGNQIKQRGFVLETIKSIESDKILVMDTVFLELIRLQKNLFQSKVQFFTSISQHDMLPKEACAAV